MLLTFSKDRFVDDIKAGRKIHTIREDKPKRWREGMKIHFWRGSPRNVKSNPYPFGEDTCKSVQDVKIVRTEPDGTAFIHGMAVLVNNRWLQDSEIELLAKNDGLTVREFRLWFVPPGTNEFSGRIIHWTDLQYQN